MFNDIVISVYLDYSFLFFFFQGGLNLSSSQPNNLTIQSFVQSYVDKYIGGFTVYNMITRLCSLCSYLKQI